MKNRVNTQIAGHALERRIKGAYLCNRLWLLKTLFTKFATIKLRQDEL